MNIIIKEFAGKVTMQIKKDGEILKLPKETLEDALEYMESQGLVYAEKIGKDRLKTLIFDR